MSIGIYYIILGVSLLFIYSHNNKVKFTLSNFIIGTVTVFLLIIGSAVTTSEGVVRNKIHKIMFEKISVDEELPEKEGKFIVFTKTSMNNSNVFSCEFHRDGKGKPHWSCHNQIVTHWLKPVK